LSFPKRCLPGKGRQALSPSRQDDETSEFPITL
jgi:hypothetical protein